MYFIASSILKLVLYAFTIIAVLSILDVNVIEVIQDFKRAFDLFNSFSTNF